MTKAELIAALQASPHADTDPVELAITKNDDVRWYEIFDVSTWIDNDGTTPVGAPILIYPGRVVMG